MRYSLKVAIVPVLSVLLSFAQTQAPLRLTLKDAIQRGLRANISVLTSDAKSQESMGTRERPFSSLLPRSYIQTSLTLEKINLIALGISAPVTPPAVGPIAPYDFRVYVDQRVFDLQTYYNWKSSE